MTFPLWPHFFRTIVYNIAYDRICNKQLPHVYLTTMQYSTVLSDCTDRQRRAAKSGTTLRSTPLKGSCGWGWTYWNPQYQVPNVSYVPNQEVGREYLVTSAGFAPGPPVSSNWQGKHISKPIRTDLSQGCIYMDAPKAAFILNLSPWMWNTKHQIWSHIC